MKGRMTHNAVEAREDREAARKEFGEEKDAQHFKRGGRAHRKHGGGVHGKEPRHRLDKRARGGKWIQGAIKHPGALHRELHVPEGKPIPEKKLERAEHSSNPTLRRRANLAKTLKGMHHG